MAQRRKQNTEKRFEDWFRTMARHYGLNPDPDDSDYDYRGAYRAGIRGPGERGHWDSAFKRRGHPTSVVGGFHVQEQDRADRLPRLVDKSEIPDSEFDLLNLGWDENTSKALAKKHGLEILPPLKEKLKLRRRTSIPGFRIEDVK